MRRKNKKHLVLELASFVGVAGDTRVIGIFSALESRCWWRHWGQWNILRSRILSSMSRTRTRSAASDFSSMHRGFNVMKTRARSAASEFSSMHQGLNIIIEQRYNDNQIAKILIYRLQLFDY